MNYWLVRANWGSKNKTTQFIQNDEWINGYSDMLAILRKKENNIKYFSFGFDEENNLRVSQNEVFEYLEDIVILDEAIEQSDRFMDIDNDYN
jgi:hypothetical protein